MSENENDYWDECEKKWVKCTCVKACGPICTGICGCEACSLAYGDYLGSMG